MTRTEKQRLLREAVLPPGKTLIPLYGHITIATYLPEEEILFMTAFAELIREFRPFTIHNAKTDFLPETSIVVATPEKTEELMVLHRRTAGMFAGSLDRWTSG